MIMVMTMKMTEDAVTHISRTAFSCSSLDFFSSISQSLCWSSSSSRSRAMSSTSCTREGGGAGGGAVSARCGGSRQRQETIVGSCSPAVVWASSASTFRTCSRRTCQTARKTCGRRAALGRGQRPGPRWRWAETLPRMSDLHLHLLLGGAVSVADDGDDAAQLHPVAGRGRQSKQVGGGTWEEP